MHYGVKQGLRTMREALLFESESPGIDPRWIALQIFISEIKAIFMAEF